MNTGGGSIKPYCLLNAMSPECSYATLGSSFRTNGFVSSTAKKATARAPSCHLDLPGHPTFQFPQQVAEIFVETWRCSTSVQPISLQMFFLSSWINLKSVPHMPSSVLQSESEEHNLQYFIKKSEFIKTESGIS